MACRGRLTSLVFRQASQGLESVSPLPERSTVEWEVEDEVVAVAEL